MPRSIQKILQDFMTYVLTLFPWSVSASLTYLILLRLNYYSIFNFIFGPIIFVFIYISILFILRILIPKLKRGVYPVGFNKGFMTWYMHSLLSRSVRVVNLHYLIFNFSVTRFLFFKAMGAKVSFYTDTSYKIVFHDYPLIEIGNGVVLAEDVELSGHLITGDRLLVAPVKIGNNVFIGRSTYIGPKTTIGKDSWIGMGNYLHNKTIPEKTKIESAK